MILGCTNSRICEGKLVTKALLGQWELKAFLLRPTCTAGGFQLHPNGGNTDQHSLRMRRSSFIVLRRVFKRLIPTGNYKHLLQDSSGAPGSQPASSQECLATQMRRRRWKKSCAEACSVVRGLGACLECSILWV